MKKLTSRQKQAITTKLKITEASILLFRQRGFDSVKVKDICDEADISVGAFYHHFKSKREIISTAYIQVDILLQERFEAKEFDTSIDKIRFLLSEGCIIIKEIGVNFVSELYKNLLASEEKYTYSENRYVNIEIEKCFEEALLNNEIKSSNSAVDLRDAVMRLARGTIFDWCIHNGDYDLKKQLVEDIDLILKG